MSFALLWAWAHWAMAVELPGLFGAEVRVERRDETVVAEALSRAAQEVVPRVVRTEDLGTAVVRTILAHPERYVARYQFVAGPKLAVEFDPDQLAGALRRNGLGLWGAERPEILLWLTIVEPGRVRLVSAQTAPDLAAELQRLADRHGLPVTLPLGDLADERAVSGPAVDADRLRDRLDRYEAEVILAGTLAARSPTSWQGHWQLLWGGHEPRWSGLAASPAESLRIGLGGAYQRLAASLVPRGGRTETIRLRVLGIESLDQAETVLTYLRRLSAVARVEWASVGNGEAEFKVDVRGGRTLLRDTLAASRRLVAEAVSDAESVPLSYRWHP